MYLGHWPQLPIGIDFFAVGDTTARQLSAIGICVTDLAQTQTGAMTSETLLQSPALQKVANEKVVIFRGVGGRSHLGDELTARGAQVHYCELYERHMPKQSFEDFAQVFEKNDSHVITLHSGEALENFCEVVNKYTAGDVESKTRILNNCMLLLPSARILEQAHAAGFAQTFAAQNATDVSMLQGLMDLKRNLKKV
ncbi:MAG: uroporphyrinogen-III synthase [Moraxellaceae bacterium]|nr:MAG: uroporphyrinogen-III synthase [Moraxellaceae bacterium]